MSQQKTQAAPDQQGGGAEPTRLGAGDDEAVIAGSKGTVKAMDTPNQRSTDAERAKVEDLREQYRLRNQECELSWLLDYIEDEDWKQVKGNWSHGQWLELHHIFGRGKNREVWQNYLMLSGQAHEWMHRNWRTIGVLLSLYVKLKKSHCKSRSLHEIFDDWEYHNLCAAWGKPGDLLSSCETIPQDRWEDRKLSKILQAVQDRVFHDANYGPGAPLEGEHKPPPFEVSEDEEAACSILSVKRRGNVQAAKLILEAFNKGLKKAGLAAPEDTQQ